MGQLQKLAYVDAKLGAPLSGQQTTRVVYDSVFAPGATSQVRFFQTFGGKTLAHTNLTQNKLDSSESMVIKTITLFQWTSAGALESWCGGNQNVISVFVGNQCVVKRLPLAQNAGRGDSSPFDRLHAYAAIEQSGAASSTSQKDLPCEVRFLTDIVIPPQTEFYVVVEGNANSGTDYGTGFVTCALSGYGKIFSAGMSF
tara:strand:+ start:3259 stop:3855 length:597 start_codon:yes stop_codon:yes gene_type:complete